MPKTEPNTTILFVCTKETRKLCHKAEAAKKEGLAVLEMLAGLGNEIKQHLNKVHSEAWDAACKEYPPLADMSNPCDLDFEQACVHLPNGESHPALALSTIIEHLEACVHLPNGESHPALALSTIIEHLDGTVMAQGTPKNLMEALQKIINGEGLMEPEEERKKVLN